MLRALFLTALTILLAGCGGGIGSQGLPERVWPPQTRLQELAVQADGSWRVVVRLTNFSTVKVRYGRIDVRLDIEGTPAGPIVFETDIGMAAGAAEPFDMTLRPHADAARTIERALAEGRSVRYSVTGEAAALEPRGRWPQQFEGVLTPVPGLSGVLR
ncbi:MAG TPA: hypothetical protein DDZ76_14385 [Xanthomonadales bacterium]|nr:hypothetical protein [Xanthomonadales bacterium]